jgi:hypothetical protein
VPGAGGITTGYGANIKITFKANENVDAEKIALVQTARSVMDGKVRNIFDRDTKEKQVNAGRMIPKGPDAGTHIDQLPKVRTPLYGFTEHRGDDVSEPQPSGVAEIGWHFKDDKGKLRQQEAWMKDKPDLNSGDIYKKASDVMKQGWSQTFETSAVAIAGRQKGTFYGSVQWGWWRLPSETFTHLAFGKKADAAASPAFMKAARLWNTSETSEGKPTIDLPVDVHVHQDGTPLWESPEGKTIGALDRSTPLGRTARIDPKGRSWWISVIVIDGPNAGKTGWVPGMYLQY